MTHYSFALPLGALCLAGGPVALAQKPPHIILLMADQQRADAMGCAGNDAVLTPHLDALAALDRPGACHMLQCRQQLVRPDRRTHEVRLVLDHGH